MRKFNKGVIATADPSQKTGMGKMKISLKIIVSLLIITSCFSNAQEKKYVQQTMKQPLAQYTFPVTKGTEADISTLQTEMGPIKNGPSARITQKKGALRFLTKTLQGKTSFAGYWHSVNEKSISGDLTLNAKKALPWPINNKYQSKISGLYVIAKGKGNWKLELKNSSNKILNTWTVNNYNKKAFTTSKFPMPASISEFKFLNFVAETNSDITIDEIGFEVTIPKKLSPLRYAYLASLGQMLNCYEQKSGLVRDKSYSLSGEFDSVPALGFVALSVATASDLGYISKTSAKKIAKTAINNLLQVPSHQSGFLPHFTKLDNNKIIAHPDSEFSTIDTALAYLSAYSAAAMLNMNAEKTAILKKIRSLDFTAVTKGDKISLGFDKKGNKLSDCYEHFGSEVSLLTLLAKLQNPEINFSYSPHPPVFGGRGFIMEIMPQLYSRFGGSSLAGSDGYGNNWYSERVDLLQNQKAVLNQQIFVGGHSAMEIISKKGKTAYLAGGSGGAGIADPVRGKGGYGTPWVAPHYAAMTSVLEPELLEARITQMIDYGLMPPLSGPAESVLLTSKNDIKLIHHRIVSLNAWFSLMGYYHAIVSQEARNDAVYAASDNDAVLAEALEKTFTAGSSGNNYSISGSIKDGSGIGILGVRINLSNSEIFAFTDASGSYNVSVASGWSGNLTPFREGFRFEPLSASFENINSNRTQNFTAINNTHKVSGHVKTSGGQGVESVVLSFSGLGGSVITDSSGYYSKYVTAGWSGTVTPKKFGYTFTPASGSVPTLTGDYTLDFEGNSSTNNISGVIKTAKDIAVQGVVVNFSNDGGSATTNNKGEYSHSVARGWSGDVIPSLSGFVFTPEKKTFTDVKEDQTQNFTALQAGFTIQAETGSPINHSSLLISSRSNAQGGQTALIKQNLGVYVNFVVADNSKVGVVVRYSNDNLNASPNETVTIIARNTSTGQETQIDQFIAKDTGDNGNGWNIFEETELQGPVSLKPGNYQLILMVSSGDNYGIEFDSFKISFE